MRDYLWSGRGLFALALCVFAGGLNLRASEPWLELEGRYGDDASGGRVDLFLPIARTANGFFFLDLRGVITDEETREGNFGVGYRHLFEDYILGVYGYFDVLESPNRNSYRQGTLGVELLTSRWEFRINGYLPDDDEHTVVAGLSGPLDDQVYIKYVGTNVFAAAGGTAVYERALWGTNVEGGVTLYPGDVGMDGDIDWDLRFLLGWFYFDADDIREAVSGPMGRVELTWRDPLGMTGWQVRLGAEGRSDDVRGDSGTATLSVQLPLGDVTKDGYSPAPGTLQQRIGLPVRRDVDIVAITYEVDEEILGTLLNPITGNPLTHAAFFAAVGDDEGTGSFTDPTSLRKAADIAGPDGLLIGINGGDLISKPVFLQDGQMVLDGQDSAAWFATLELKADFDGQEVIIGPNAKIPGGPNLIPLGAGAGGGAPTIHVEDTYENILITLADNNVFYDQTVDGGGKSVDLLVGFGVENLSPFFNNHAWITGSTFLDSDSDGVHTEGANAGVFTIYNSRFDGVGDGISLAIDANGGQALTVEVLDSYFTNLNGWGIDVSADIVGTVRYLIANNTITDAFGNAIGVYASDAPSAFIAINNNTIGVYDGITDAVDDGISVAVSDIPVATILIDPNYIYDTGENGIRFSAIRIDDLLVDILGSAEAGDTIIAGSDWHGVDIFLQQIEVGQVNLERLDVSDAGHGGVHIDGRFLGDISLFFSDVTVDAITGYGVSIDQDGGGGGIADLTPTLAVTMQGVTVTDAEGYGVRVGATHFDLVEYSLTNIQVDAFEGTGLFDAAVAVEAHDNDTVNGLLNHITIGETVGITDADGILVDSSGNQDFQMTLANLAVMAITNGDGVVVDARGETLYELQIGAFDIHDITGEGIDLEIVNSEDITVRVLDGAIARTELSGILLNLHSDSDYTADFTFGQGLYLSDIGVPGGMPERGMDLRIFGLADHVEDVTVRIDDTHFNEDAGGMIDSDAVAVILENIDSGSVTFSNSFVYHTGGDGISFDIRGLVGDPGPGASGVPYDLIVDNVDFHYLSQNAIDLTIAGSNGGDDPEFAVNLEVTDVLVTYADVAINIIADGLDGVDSELTVDVLRLGADNVYGGIFMDTNEVNNLDVFLAPTAIIASYKGIALFVENTDTNFDLEIGSDTTAGIFETGDDAIAITAQNVAGGSIDIHDLSMYGMTTNGIDISLFNTTDTGQGFDLDIDGVTVFTDDIVGDYAIRVDVSGSGSDVDADLTGITIVDLGGTQTDDRGIALVASQQAEFTVDLSNTAIASQHIGIYIQATDTDAMDVNIGASGNGNSVSISGVDAGDFGVLIQATGNSDPTELDVVLLNTKIIGTVDGTAQGTGIDITATNSGVAPIIDVDIDGSFPAGTDVLLKDLQFGIVWDWDNLNITVEDGDATYNNVTTPTVNK